MALSVRICVAGTNKVEGTMSRLLGTDKILTSKHHIAALKVKQGHFATAILVLHNFLLRLKVLRSIRFKYLHDSNVSTVMQLEGGKRKGPRTTSDV